MFFTAERKVGEFPLIPRRGPAPAGRGARATEAATLRRNKAPGMDFAALLGDLPTMMGIGHAALRLGRPGMGKPCRCGR
jgi:hypothetical protein